MLTWPSPPDTRPTRALAKRKIRSVDTCRVHQLSGEDEEGNGQQRKTVETGHHPLGCEIDAAPFQEHIGQ